MNTLWKPLLAAIWLFALAAPATAQIQARSYATEDLRTLSRDDQARVIRQEYLEQSGGRRIADDQLRFYLDQVNRSDWRFSDIKRDIAESLVGSTGPAPDMAIRCESTDNRRRDCPTPWYGPSRLTRQLSGTPCIEGRNWSSQNGGITVWSGCRGEFAQGWGGGSEFGTIRCESADKRAANCPTPWRGGSRVVRQISDTRCREGRNWSSGDGQVNVWAGCRAEFGPDREGPLEGDGYTTTCSSQNGRYTTCNWPPGQGRPRLLQQLSSQPCIEGRTWGTDRSNRLWVDAGCRGRFGGDRYDD